MAEGRISAGTRLFWAGMAAMAAALFASGIVPLLLAAPPAPGTVDLSRIILVHSALPRAAVALVAGASLGLAGLLLQRVLRNPLAEPSTLGIAAGAQLAMTAATLYAPQLIAGGRQTIAFAGALAAAGLVLALTWRRGLEPVSVVLAGMMIALTATAASAALILANGEYMLSLFIWGGGALDQQSWAPALALAVRLLVGLCVARLLLRPLAILGVSDESARSLGVGVGLARLAVIAVAVWLAAGVTAEVGIIGFVGLAAPALAQIAGARSLPQRFIAAPLIGAILLWLADGLVQAAASAGAQRLSAGAVTALLGGPLILWLLPRLRLFEWPAWRESGARPGRSERPGLLLVLLLATAVAVVLCALTLGRGPGGWTLAHGPMLDDLLFWRIPRLLSAGAAGAMLAAAGFLLQRVTGNPLASPEILGIGSGAGVGLAIVLLALPGAGAWPQLAGSVAGAFAVLGAIVTLARSGHFGPERLLLAGVAAGATCSAVLTALISTGDRNAFTLLAWLSGSAGQSTPGLATAGAALAFLGIAPLALSARWLAVVALGDAGARAAGLDVGRVRLILTGAAALLTAAGSLLVGPLSFVGLIAPHLARLLGLTRPLTALAGSVLIGIALMVLSDWLARMAAFPYQLPVGLFASLLGGPYLVWMLGRGARRV